MSSVPRVFLSHGLLVGGSATLPDDAAHHLRNVLRMRVGEAVTLLDGAGNQAIGRLTEVDKERVRVEFGQITPCLSEPPFHAIVCQALPKSLEKVEQVLQHGTELGAAGFVLFASERSVARLDDRRAEGKLERWRRIVLSAAEQSGRGRVPTVSWSGRGLPVADGARRIVLHESAGTPLRETLETVAVNLPLALVVGPEGGLTEPEVAHWIAEGAVSASLGPRILRTETAALAALAQIGYRFDG